MPVQILLALSFLIAACSPARSAVITPQANEVQVEQEASEPSRDIGGPLVEKVVEICSTYPEVERAFVLSKVGENGQTIYMFVPIFDRKVSDEVLDRVQSAYKVLAPDGPGLEMVLLARNTWKRSLAGVAPVYVRAKVE